MSEKIEYTEDSIKSLEWNEHIRLRPGMYIGKLGDGSSPEDGIYILLKEIIDNSIDEFVMGAGKRVEIEIKSGAVEIRDYGRGIPLGKLVDCVSRINTGGKYDGEAFKKSVGLNGVGTKAVNALSEEFIATTIRDGQKKSASFSKGVLVSETKPESTNGKNGTIIRFVPDTTIFRNYEFIHEYIEERLWNYAYLNKGLTLILNGKSFRSEKGLLDLLTRHTDDSIRYPIIHLESQDIEIALTHGDRYGEHYYTFVNGQHTTQGGTHQAAFREALVKTVREFYKKDFDPSDIRMAVIAAVSIRIQEPVFESQTKTKLGSTSTVPDGPSLRTWMGEFVKEQLDNFLHQNAETAQALLRRIQQSERERKEIAGIKKLANERARKANLHNKKLRDCRIHAQSKHPKARDSTIFITEGDSASGSLTKARSVETQAVFSLKGKPLNTFGLTKKVVYENEEFNLLQHALDIENGVENLKYNQVVLATDADVDGMHIRLLMMTFFLQFFPEVIENGHLFILQTPLFRVRNKQTTKYCYSELEKEKALKDLGAKSEITRFKGLGEISPDEFEQFIQEDMRLEPVVIQPQASISKMLQYFMGKNTPERQEFIMDYLKLESLELG
jgi:topoisomerase IV subunit B